jgi:hypothetical protein
MRSNSFSIGLVGGIGILSVLRIENDLIRAAGLPGCEVGRPERPNAGHATREA